MPKRERPEEMRAARIIAQHLGREVIRHDDGSQDGLYDLRVGPMAAPEFAIECVASVDGEYIKALKAITPTTTLILPVEGDWLIEVSTRPPFKTVKPKLPEVIGNLNDLGVTTLRVDAHLECQDPAFSQQLRALGITYLHRFRDPGSGRVDTMLGGSGGCVNTTGRGIASWLVSFLTHQDQKDVLRKLTKSEARWKHAFVTLVERGAPWEIYSYFLVPPTTVPQDHLALPEPLSAIWLMPSFGDKGLYWDGWNWQVIQSINNAV